jgi:hypothetical protein
MLLGVCHLIRKDTLQCRQPPVRLLDFYEPSLAVGHTSYAVGNAYLRNAAELVGKTAKCPHTFTEVPLYFFFSHARRLLQNFLHFKGCIKFCCVYGGGPNSKVKENKMSENFRRAARSLVDIGKELAFISKCLEDIRTPHNVSTYDAMWSARHARSAATRMARNFQGVAYILAGIAEQEAE